MFGEEGNYLSYIPLTGNPWDVATSNENIAFVTMPTEQCILQVDQEKIYICSKTVFSDSNAFISCVSAAMSMKGPGNTYVGFCSDGKLSAGRVSGGVLYV